MAASRVAVGRREVASVDQGPLVRSQTNVSVISVPLRVAPNTTRRSVVPSQPDAKPVDGIDVIDRPTLLAPTDCQFVPSHRWNANVSKDR